MVSQLRIYTINRGMMDSWLKLFEEHNRPLHQRLGIPVEATWVNADRTEFLWVRSFCGCAVLTTQMTSQSKRRHTSPPRSAPLWATSPPAT